MKILRWICLALFSGVGARAQGPLIPPAFYAVQGAPFTLTVETHTEPASLSPSRTQRILRDTAGRQRYEPTAINGVPQSSLITILDPVVGRTIKLDTEAMTAAVSLMTVGHLITLDVSQPTSLPPPTSAKGQTLLGLKQIVGLEAWGQETKGRELWLSTHYRMPLMQVVRSERGTTTQSVFAFEAAEPDPALFQIPSGFTVVDALPPQAKAPFGGEGVSPPRVIKSVDPEFSEQERRSRLNGTVVVSLMVDEAGLPQNVKVVRGVRQDLDQKAVQAVQQYQFKPAMRNGIPVKVDLTIDVNFHIF
ncbi:energy transducer TonB [Granulicella paludicola]|uniref:energy transducer TonB n=1 Tax=Granulicella paludicola TaxID=474951 RepID=UPI0021E0A290|nr:energy transducer TonB [Granulicella paludicola]